MTLLNTPMPTKSALNMQPYIKIQDDDGHRYWIPPSLEEEFEIYINDWEQDGGINWEQYRTHGHPDNVPDYWKNNILQSFIIT